MEIALIKSYGSFGKGYNACAGGTGARGVIRSGQHHSAAAKAKISAAHRRIWSERAPPFLGRKHTEETKAKMRAAHLGKAFSAEHKAALSAAHVGKRYPGRKHSDATRKRMSETRKGVPKTGKGLENIRKGCAKRTGVPLSAEHRVKISEARLALPMVSCPHCNKTGRSGGGMIRYHFDNCRWKA